MPAMAPAAVVGPAAQLILQHPMSVLLLAGLLSVLVPWAVNRWKYRHIPGPFSWPLIGDLPWIVQYGLHDYGLMCQRKYGRIFKIYTGNTMTLMVADPEISKRLTYKMINRSVPAQLRLETKDDAINTTGLAAASGEMWRTMRMAWQPAFQSGSLEGYTDLMDDCATQLAQYLHKKGESGEVVEIWRALGKMTLAVVGSTAYGVNFHTMPGHELTADQEAEGVALQDACQTLFTTMGIRGGSKWQVVNILLPVARPVVSWLARTFPDQRLLLARQARHTIRDVSLQLINRWRRGHTTDISAVAAGATAAAAAFAPHGPLPDHAAAAAGANTQEQPLVESIADIGQDSLSGKGPASCVKVPGASGAEDAKVMLRRAQGKGVNPGSFLGLMLNTKDSTTGQPFQDDVIVAQSNTFILAGYETTANTLSFCIYNIARDPEVQRRLLQEVDQFGRDRRVTYQDLDKFPFIEAVVRESLRLYPPATILNRRVKAGGFVLTRDIVVPEGVGVFPFLYGYQRSPEYWPAAEEFRPERWLPDGKHLAPTTPDAWTPFGSGARMCIGWRFALQEAKISLVRLYQHQTYRLLPGQVPLALQQNLTLSPKNGVKVHVIPRA